MLRESLENASVSADSDDEEYARLHGLMAMLALPPVRRATGGMRKYVVEIEASRNVWVPVDSIVIDDEGLTFVWGANGTRVERKFKRCPPWRVER